MVSFCIKSLNRDNIHNLEHFFDRVTFPNIIYSTRKFRKFYNLIIHYTSNDKNSFYKFLSGILSQYIIDNYEESIVKTQLKLDFFYFSKSEQADIMSNLKRTLNTKTALKKKFSTLESSIKTYISQNKSCLIDGFINFRISTYKKYLQDQLEKTVHNYVIYKEYIEYVNILREYITETPAQIEQIHLLYSQKEKSLLDNNKKIITTTYGKKYISDISFSENDFILNSILSLLPQKICIHTNQLTDNFITFLSSIFEEKCVICSGCDICSKPIKKYPE